MTIAKTSPNLQDKVKSVSSPGALDKLMQIAHGYVTSSSLNAVVRLKIADIIKDDCIVIDEIAKKTNTNSDALYRVLRLLASIGIFEEKENRCFANNLLSQHLRSDIEGSQFELLAFLACPIHFKAYADMIPTLKDGSTAVEHVWQKGIFEVFQENPEAQIRFDNAMTSMTKRVIPSLLANYDFSDIEKLVDVGGGHGLLLTAILKKYPSMHGVLFDREHVTVGAQKLIQESGLTNRCQIISGDFFDSVPETSTVIMKHIIHDWEDHKAIKILQNCRKAISNSPKGKIILLEMLISKELNIFHPSKFLDVEMLMLPGGKERSENEYANLFSAAGLKLTRIVQIDDMYSAIEVSLP